MIQCKSTTCPPTKYQDEFDNDQIKKQFISKVRIYEVYAEDTTLYSEQYFDELGRTDSLLMRINNTRQYFEERYFSGNHDEPDSIFQSQINYNPDGSKEEVPLLHIVKKQNNEIETYYKDGQMEGFALFQLTDKGYPEIQESYLRDSSLAYKIEYTYDQFHRMIKFERYNQQEELTGYKTLVYTGSQTIASSESTYVMDSLYSSIKRSVEGCDTIIGEEEYDQEDVLISRLKNTYFPSGLPKSVLIENFRDGYSSELLYKYEVKK
jgi:hypothetical protein